MTHLDPYIRLDSEKKHFVDQLRGAEKKWFLQDLMVNTISMESWDQ